VAEPTSNDQLFSTIEQLVEGWCDRRAYSALREVLQGWPSMPLTDGWAVLLEALRATRGLAADDLTEDEAARLDHCIAAVERALPR
jgi:hypothetical protein